MVEATATGGDGALGGVREYTPMLLRGSAGFTKQLRDGKLPAGFDVLAHQTFQDVGDSAGPRREFTVVVGRVPESVAFVKDLACRDRRAQIRFEERDLERFGSPHEVELESTDFDRRYQLEAIPGQDEVFLRQLFSPAFIDWLSEDAPERLCFELNEGHLCVGIPGHTDDKDTLDDLCGAAAKVAERIREVSASQDGSADAVFRGAVDPLVELLLPKVKFDSPPPTVHDASLAYLPVAKRQGVAVRAGLKRAAGIVLGTIGIVFLMFLGAFLLGKASWIGPAITGVLVVAGFVFRFRNGQELAAIPLARALGEAAFAEQYAKANGMELEDPGRFAARFGGLELPAIARQAMSGTLPGTKLDGHLALCADDVDRAAGDDGGIAQIVGAITTAVAERNAPADAYDVAVVEGKGPHDLSDKAEKLGVGASAADGVVAVWQPCPAGRRARSAEELTALCAKAETLLG